MQFKIQVTVIDDNDETTVEDVLTLTKLANEPNNIGLSIHDSKGLLKSLQQVIISHQSDQYIKAHIACPHCQGNRRIKGNQTHQYRTPFGVITIPGKRLYHCDCEESESKTLSVLTDWLQDLTSPELQYLETKWASLMSYGLTADLLKDVLPVGDSLNAATIRNRLHQVAKRQEKDLEGKPDCISGCPNEWGALAKPGKPMVIGIDGGYVRNWHDKKTNFEVITGKSLSKDVTAKRFGFVQKCDDNPRRKLMAVLESQGMQANQQITFLSDGADNLRALQFDMYPESTHVLDWFHVTMRLTVLNQFAKGLENADLDAGTRVKSYLESAKWYLWHGNVENALDKFDSCCVSCENTELNYENRKKFLRHLIEMHTYIKNNKMMIPNYGEMYRYGETISTAFIESTVNEVIAKRMVKKQQMQWDQQGAHYLISAGLIPRRLRRKAFDL
jgi:hypothetical protein